MLVLALMAFLTQSAGVAVIETRDVDLGIVGLGTDPEVAFLVGNEGAVPLVVAVPELPAGLRLVDAPRDVPAGGTSVIRLAIDTYKAGANESWDVPLMTSDPTLPVVRLTVRAAVRAFIDVSPPSSRITFVRFGPEGGTRHIVAADDDPAFEVQAAVSPVPYLRSTVREALPDERVSHLGGRQWRVDVEIGGDAPVGPIGALVELRTNHPRQPLAYLPVSGFVRPVFAVTPPALTLHELHAVDAPTTRLSLVMKNFAETAVEVREVTSNVAGLVGVVHETTPGHAWRIDVHQTPALGIGAFSGALIVHTSHPQVGRVRVPMSGAVLPAAP